MWWRLWTALCLSVAVSSLSAEQTTGVQIVGIPWVGDRGVTEPVTQIMVRQRQLETQAALHEFKPRLMAPRKFLPQNPNAPFVPQWPPRGDPGLRAGEPFSGPKAAQAVGVSFLAVQVSESGFIPPDSMGGVGPSQVLVCVNGRIKLFDKSGTPGALNATTDSFFSSVTSDGTTDPRVRYDRLSGRWFVVMVDIPGSQKNNQVMIAVSSGPVITDTTSFTFFSFQHNVVSPAGDNNKFADYPTLGIDNNALYIGVNVFGKVSFAGTTGFVVRKSSVLGAGPIVVTAFRSLGTASTSGPYTPQGVDNDDPTATQGYFIGTDTVSFGDLVLRRITDPGGTPAISGNIDITVPATVNPMGGVVALGVSTPLDDLDDRLFAAKIKNGSLWTAHNIEVNNTGTASTTGGRDGARWYEIVDLTTSPRLQQSGTVFDPGLINPPSYWVPSCAVSGQGHMALGCSVAGANQFAEIAATGRFVNDPLGSIQAPEVVQTSATPYNLGTQNPRRWGDYSITMVDPNDDMTMWTVQEYCNATNSWGVRVIQLLAPPPATPVSCNPPTVTRGSTTVLLTGTSTSGSGFFDPGTGFPNHLSAVVNGSGVTVNGATFIDRNHLALNLTVSPEAAAGLRTIAVTNPDGQTATSPSGILGIAATVQGRLIFYNNSSFDGNNAAANAADDGAIATDKTALLPGGTASFANYTSYSRGINGIMVDIANLGGTPTASDFMFKVGNDSIPGGWLAAPAPSIVTARAGEGVNGSDRITILWADNAIQKRWLEATVKATPATGLSSADVFYFGNAIGESGNSATDAKVNATDEILARNNTRAFGQAPVDFPYDYNRDSRVNATDEILARNNATSSQTALQLITVP